MNKLKQYASRFLKEEEGAELIEWAIIIAVAGLLFVVAANIVGSVKGQMEAAGNDLETGFDTMRNNAGGGGGNSQPTEG